MTRHEIVAIVPIRFLPSTKNRLKRSLDESQRQNLVKAMLNDVIKAIRHSTMITRLVILTGDKNYLGSNFCQGVEFHESDVRGLNEELDEYLRLLSKTGKGHAIIVLGDLPLLTGIVLDNLILFGLRLDRPVIARDWKGLGTNVLFFTFPHILKFHFGEDSFEKHLTELQSKGFDPLIYHAMETALDIDDDTTIKILIGLGKGNPSIQNTETYQLIQVDEKFGR